MQNDSGKLSIREKIGYSVGDTASNLYYQTFIVFLLKFYTDVFGISAAAVGTMFLVTRIWDAVNDSIMGAIADRTNSKWGKFRPYLLWGAVPFGILGVLMFTTPDMGPMGKLIWAYVTYTLMMMIYTIINVPYSALMCVITPNTTERTIVSSFRFVAAFVGVLIVQYSVLTIVEKFGGDNEQLGWQIAMAVMSVLAVVLFLITFATTKERVSPPKGQKTSPVQDFKDLLLNVPWLLAAGATVFQLIYLVMRGGSIMYYFEYFVKGQDVVLFGKTHSYTHNELVTAFLLSGTLVTVLGAMLTSFISRALGKSKTYAMFLGISGVACGAFYVLRPDQVVMMFVLQLITSFCVGFVAVLQWAIYTDIADYSEWKKGRRATGLIMAASMFALKLGVAIGGAAVAWMLAGYGYAPNAEQTPQVLQGIRLSMSVCPAVFAFVGVGLMLFYPLNRKKMLQIETELIERRKNYETPDTEGDTVL